MQNREIGSQIYVIDDSDAGQSSIVDHLDLSGVSITTFTNPQEGFEAVTSLPPDMLIIDVAHAGLGAWNLCDRVRRTPHVQELPIIMVTGVTDIETRIKSFEMGADDVIQKPYNRAELSAIVRNVTKLNRYRKLAEQRNELYYLLKQVQESYDKTIEGWMRALDLRDRETEGHSTRVAELTVALARKFGIAGDELERIRRGALLHDIGKLAISDTILKKKGRLTDEEREIMMKHPIHAHKMLYPVEYLRPSLDIPVYHHERWDGLGYPYGLKEEKIPVSARIFAVVDVWDALSFDRPYRAAMEQDKVRQILIEDSGKHFDPRIVPVFLEMLDQITAPITTEEYWENFSRAA